MTGSKNSPYADRVAFFPEDPILGTGGALRNAESFLSSGPFIVHNSDILLNIDFSRLIEEHLASGNIATLVCHRLPHLSNVVIDRNGQVLDVENAGASRPDPSIVADKVAYTGIAVYSPEILKFLPQGVSHATVAWIAASKAGHKVRAMDFTGCYWNDVGNPVTYARGVLDALRENGETVHRSVAARCGRIEIDGYVVLEAGSEVEDGARIRNCIVMPGARVKGNHGNRILGPDYAVALTESDMQPSLHAAEKKRVSLSDPLFANYFGIRPASEGAPLTQNSEPEPRTRHTGPTPFSSASAARTAATSACGTTIRQPCSWSASLTTLITSAISCTPGSSPAIRSPCRASCHPTRERSAPFSKTSATRASTPT